MKYKKLVLIVFLSILFVSFSSPGKNNSNNTHQSLLKIASSGASRALMNANNVTSWVRPNGFFNWDVAQSWNGEFPKLSGVGTIFAEGIVFGGLCTDGLSSNVLRVTGNTYFNGMQAGSILTSGGNATGAEDASLPDVNRVWGVRPDVSPSSSSYPDLTNDAASYYQITPGSVGASQIQSIITQYKNDWKDWPASKGAPWYIDTVKIVRNDSSFDKTNPHHIPGIPGATKTIWFVCNDLNSSVSEVFAGSPPMGIEQQMTMWAYASSTPLNNIIFKQVKLIYKGQVNAPANSEIDSMYVVQWADGDDGDAGDDYAGCDSVLNLGFQYNANLTDAKYAAVGLAAPAVGYDFLNGVAFKTPNANDSAVVNFQWRHGYQYKLARPLTAYDFFAAGSAINDPDDGTYTGTQQWYNLMRGDLPRPAYPVGIPFYTSSTYASSHGIVTSYCLAGDPTTGSGWVDGADIQAGDRRMVNVHGPFTLKLHDTAEVVIALVDGMGKDNVSSVQVLKFNSKFSIYAFEQLFDLPSAPPTPKVVVTELPQEIMLNWGENEQHAKVIENFSSKSFVFEGYNVYQLPSPSASLSDGYRVATYDIADAATVIYNNTIDPKTGYVVNMPSMFGTNSGLKRFIDITQDYINQKPLVNGQQYYFVVTAYAWDTTKTVPFSYLESEVLPITITPHSSNPGIVPQAKVSQVLDVAHTAGVSTLSILPTVVSPDLLTGHQYEITFFATDSSAVDGTDENTGNPATFFEPNVRWKLRDVTRDSVLYSTLGFSKKPSTIIKDGLQWFINGIPWYVYGVTSEINSLVYSPKADFNLVGVNAGLQAFGGGLDIGPNFSGSSLLPSQCLKIIKVVFSNDPSKQQKCYCYLRGGTPNYKYNGYGTFPGKVYDITDPLAAPKQLNVAIAEQNGSSAQDLKWDPTVNNGDREYLGILSSAYDGDNPDVGGTKHIDYTSVRFNSGSLDIVYELWATLNDGSQPLFHEGDVMTFNANIPPVLTPSPSADKYSINTQPYINLANVTSAANAETDKINVFPNPYFGMNIRETSRLNKFVTFNHLPASATIRIFNLAGVLVKTIEKNDPSQFSTWNLLNDHNLPVASGIYIVYVDMPSLGKSKILKLALIQEEQILPNY